MKESALYDLIGGELDKCDTDLRAVGFSRVGEDMWQRGAQRIRWVRDQERIKGIDGTCRKFVAWIGCDQALVREALIRRFEITPSILHYARHAK